MLFPTLAMQLLSLAAGGAAAGPGEILELTEPIVVELDHEGRVVWTMTGGNRFLSIDVDRLAPDDGVRRRRSDPRRDRS